MEPHTPQPIAESRALTGLRGIAALLVMVHHFQLHLGIGQHLPYVQHLLLKGYLGVDLFFVLSGFVLSMTYAGWFDGHRALTLESYLRFLIRRVARLWPLHAAILLILVLLHLNVPDVTFSRNLILANVAMIQAWGISAEINSPAWSISTEFLAYILFPFLVTLALRGRKRPWLCILAIAAALAICMHFAPPLGPGRRGLLDIYFNYSPLPALRCLAGFTLGMLAWRAGRTPWLRRCATTPWTGPLALALVFALMLGRANDLLIFPIMAIVVIGMHFGDSPIHRALARNPLHRLGILSYAIYLIHFALLQHFPFGWAPLAVILIFYVLVTLALATAAFLLIEAPARRLIRNVGEAALAVAYLAAGRPLHATPSPPLQDKPH